jgi:hypothetical protein
MGWHLIIENMKSCAIVVGVIFVLAGMTSSLAGQLALAPRLNPTPAGCHNHGNKAPTPAPADHACCVAEHESAILRASLAPPPTWQDTFEARLPALSCAAIAINNLPSKMVLSIVPHDLTPLRV